MLYWDILCALQTKEKWEGAKTYLSFSIQEKEIWFGGCSLPQGLSTRVQGKESSEKESHLYPVNQGYDP